MQGHCRRWSKRLRMLSFYYSSREGGSNRHYGDLYDFQVVKDGDKLSLGKRELTFVTLPMLHWPDSMATYCADDGILFSNDAFGQHYAAAKRFDDEVDLGILFYEAKKIFCQYTLAICEIN